MRKLFVLLAAVALAFAFATPAKADVSISGYAAFNTYWNDVDYPGAKYDTSDTSWEMDRVCSRLTFAFKEGPFGAIVELRPLTANMVRHWWGTWNFGAGTLGIGQFWTPDFQSISTAKYMCGAAEGDYGDPGGLVRQEMVQLQFGGFKIAAAKPNAGGVIPAAAGPEIVFLKPADAEDDDVLLTPAEPGYNAYYRPASGYATVTETTLPRLIASYNLNVAMVSLNFFGAYQSYDQVNTATSKSYGIDSYSYGATAKLGFGPLTVAAALWGGQNITELGYSTIGFAAYYDSTSDSIKDTDYMGYGLDVVYKINDAWNLAAGYFAGESELDRPGTWEDPSAAYHVNATWRVAKNVYISPEFFVQDKDDVTKGGVVTEEEQTTWYGVYWQIKF